jgi:hypothetical protein
MTEFNLQDELVRIANMDHDQILLKARNHKHYKHMSLRDYQQLGGAINSRLNDFGYKIEPACCGRFNIVKL